MNKFNWFKAIGFGIAIWLLMFAIASLAVGIGIYASLWTQLALALIAGILGYVFAAFLDSYSDSQALGYGVVWAAAGIILDLTVVSLFSLQMFGFWQYWLGYALLLFAPWVQLQMRQGSSLPAR